MDWTTGVRYSEGEGIFSPHHSVQTGPGAHTASYLMGIMGSSPVGKLTTHLHLAQRLRMNGTIPQLLHTSSWRGV